MSWKKNNSLILILLGSLPVAAQFRYSCTLDSVKEAGFYSIPISPDLSAHIKTDLSDLRIADEKGQWIPHIIQRPFSHSNNDIVDLEMPIISNETTGSENILIIQNKSDYRLSNFFLNVKNATINRFASLSGSDNEANWYTITDSLLLKDPDISDNKTILKIFFPAVHYNYYRIIISNGKKDPLNILEVINERPGSPETVERLITNPKCKFNQVDSVGYSVITIQNANNFHVSQLRLHVSSPKYFERKASLFTSFPGSFHELMKRIPKTDFIISSNSSGDYNVSTINHKLFYLLIENRDNPPLQFESIETAQAKKELIAWLDKGKNYKLLFDDSSANGPDYDLQQFSGKIPKSVPTLNVGKIVAIDLKKTNTTSKETKWWLWPTMITVILLLGYTTLILTRDVKKTK